MQTSPPLLYPPPSDEDAILVLDQTPFYAEGGGQVGDTGTLTAPPPGTNGSTPSCVAHVLDVQKAAGDRLHAHVVRVAEGKLRVGDTVSGVVDAAKRRRTRAHHTATHLL